MIKDQAMYHINDVIVIDQNGKRVRPASFAQMMANPILQAALRQCEMQDLQSELQRAVNEREELNLRLVQIRNLGGVPSVAQSAHLERLGRQISQLHEDIRVAQRAENSPNR